MKLADIVKKLEVKLSVEIKDATIDDRTFCFTVDDWYHQISIGRAIINETTNVLKNIEQ